MVTIHGYRPTTCVLSGGSRCRSVGAVHETNPAEPPKPRLLDRVRSALRSRHYSRRTEEAYVAWIRRYILFHGKRHPAELGAPEITRFLSWLAVDGKVAASTQNQALSALLFLYQQVLDLEVPWLDDIVRAKRPQRLPVVLTREEVRAVLQRLEGAPRLMAYLLYGACLRLLECCRLRVQDVDFASNEILVRAGKGDKDRVTMLPEAVKPDLARRWPWHASIRTQAGNGRGTGSSRPRARTSIGSPVSGGGITCTSRCCSGSSRRRCSRPASRSGPALTRYATRSRRTCWRTTTISARSKRCSATGGPDVRTMNLRSGADRPPRIGRRGLAA